MIALALIAEAMDTLPTRQHFAAAAGRASLPTASRSFWYRHKYWWEWAAVPMKA
jgi:hypothetical protein